MFVSDKLIKENPQILRRTIRAVLRANRFIDENREETIRTMTKFVPQTTEIAARSYDVELKALARDGQMTDSEIEFQMERLADKKRPLVVPKDLDKSYLWQRAGVEGSMPPMKVKDRPTDDDKAVLKKWIEAGAPDFLKEEKKGAAVPARKEEGQGPTGH